MKNKKRLIDNGKWTSETISETKIYDEYILTNNNTGEKYKYAFVKTWNADSRFEIFKAAKYLYNKDKNYQLTISGNFDYDTTAEKFLKIITYVIINGENICDTHLYQHIGYKMN